MELNGHIFDWCTKNPINYSLTLLKQCLHVWKQHINITILLPCIHFPLILLDKLLNQNEYPFLCLFSSNKHDIYFFYRNMWAVCFTFLLLMSFSHTNFMRYLNMMTSLLASILLHKKSFSINCQINCCVFI